MLGIVKMQRYYYPLTDKKMIMTECALLGVFLSVLLQFFSKTIAGSSFGELPRRQSAAALRKNF